MGKVRVDSLESSKERFDVEGRDYYYTTIAGDRIRLTSEDLSSISKFNSFISTYAFILWLKYKLQDKTGK